MSHGEYAKAKNTGGGVMPQQVNVNIPDINLCPSYHCPHCMNNIFVMSWRIWQISALISPTGIAMQANQQVWTCTGCHLAWDQGQLKMLSPAERDELIAAMKEKQVEMQRAAGAEVAGVQQWE